MIFTLQLTASPLSRQASASMTKNSAKSSSLYLKIVTVLISFNYIILILSELSKMDFNF